MASLNFKFEKIRFIEFYNEDRETLESAKNTFIVMINTILTNSKQVNLAKVDGRVKDREEALRKFSIKYQKNLEAKSQEYEIRHHVTDLIGLRAICLYEDDIDNAAVALAKTSM